MSTRTILGTAALLCMAALPATGTAQGCTPSYGLSPYRSNYGSAYPMQYVRGGAPFQVGGATVVFGPGGGYYGQAYGGSCAWPNYGYGDSSGLGYGGYRRVTRNYWGW